MKKIIVTVFIVVAIFDKVSAQAPPITAAAGQLATRIAQKMKDSLGLTSAQQEKIYAINIDLHNQKMATRQRYTGGDSLRIYLQRVENTRDSLYKREMTEEKYNLYKAKKPNLVSNN